MKGLGIKLKNRRVCGCRTPTGSTRFVLKNLINGEVCKTEIGLSDEALDAMVAIREALRQAND